MILKGNELLVKGNKMLKISEKEILEISKKLKIKEREYLIKNLKEIKEKAKYVEWNNNQRKEQYAIFAKSFKKRVKGARCFDLKDIEKIMNYEK